MLASMGTGGMGPNMQSQLAGLMGMQGMGMQGMVRLNIIHLIPTTFITTTMRITTTNTTISDYNHPYRF